MGYRNDADRLFGIYGSSGKLEDYVAANKTYEKMIESGNYSNQDLLEYALLQDYHSMYYVKKAIGLYNKIIENGKETRDDVYYKSQSQLIVLLARNNRSHESIDKYKQMVKDEPNNYRAYDLLHQAYFWAKQYDDAWLALEAAMKFEPNNAGLLSDAGYVCKALGRYDEAIDFYDKAFAINSDDASTLYGKACLFMDTGRDEEAIMAWQDVIDWNNSHGFSEANKWPETEIAKRKKKLISEK